MSVKGSSICPHWSMFCRDTETEGFCFLSDLDRVVEEAKSLLREIGSSEPSYKDKMALDC